MRPVPPLAFRARAPGARSRTRAADLVARLATVDPWLLAFANNATIIIGGKLFLQIQRTWTQMAVALFATIATELAGAALTRTFDQKTLARRIKVSVSVTLGVLLFLKGHDWWIYGLIGCAAVASKFLIQHRGRHIFNPVVFGVVFAFTFLPTDSVYVRPEQFSSDLGFILMTFVLGNLATLRVERWFLVTAYYAVTCAIGLGVHVLTDTHILVVLGPEVGVLGAVFAYFMITDPRTTPSDRGAQILYGGAVAVANLALRWHQIVYSNFVALFLVCALWPLVATALDRARRKPGTTPAAGAMLGPALGVAVLVVCFSILDARERLSDGIENVRESEYATARTRFTEVSRLLGIDSRHRSYFPHPSATSDTVASVLRSIFPGAAVADVDGDGFVDVYIAQPHPDVPDRFYRNVAGDHFEDATAAFGLAEVAATAGNSIPIFADLDGDGDLDLLLGRMGCHALLLFDGDSRRFVDATERLGGVCSNPRAIAVHDVDRDGRLDVVIGNYWPAGDLSVRIPRHFLHGSPETGGINLLLVQQPDGTFDARTPFPGRNHTNSIAFIDADGDGWDDVFFGNDYAYDKFFLNVEGKRFELATGRYFPFEEHGFAGMNADVQDFDGDGRDDLYVSNIYKPPYASSFNVLWRGTGGGAYENVALATGSARCGFSWGARMADFDADGDLDLFVTNGKVRGSRVSREHPGRSFWYTRLTYRSIPYSIRDLAFNRDDVFYDFSNTQHSGIEQDCYFEQVDGKFHNVATAAGVTDHENGRGVATLDYDNDGRLDVLVTTMAGPVLLYRNDTPHDSGWLGITLVDAAGSSVPFGAVATVGFSDGRSVRRRVEPLGTFAQSDARIFVAAGEGREIASVHVAWPSGAASDVPVGEPGRYVEVREADATPRVARAGGGAGTRRLPTLAMPARPTRSSDAVDGSGTSRIWPLPVRVNP